MPVSNTKNYTSCNTIAYIQYVNRDVGSGGQFSASVRPHNLATGFRPPLARVVSAEPFSHRTGTLWCLQKEMTTYRHWSVSLWQNPDDVPHCRILSSDKTEWRLIPAALCGWRCCFVADQLWAMSPWHAYEKKKICFCHILFRLSVLSFGLYGPSFDPCALVSLNVWGSFDK